MQDLKGRSKKFAVSVIRFTRTLSRGFEEDVLRRQLIRSATSAGAHYRASQRAKSPSDFLNKITCALEESDESEYWLEIMIETDMATKQKAASLLKEAGEFTAMFAAMCRNLKRKGVRQSRRRRSL